MGIASIVGASELLTGRRGGLTNESDLKKERTGVPFLINETLVSD